MANFKARSILSGCAITVAALAAAPMAHAAGTGVPLTVTGSGNTVIESSANGQINSTSSAPAVQLTSSVAATASAAIETGTAAVPAPANIVPTETVLSTTTKILNVVSSTGLTTNGIGEAATGNAGALLNGQGSIQGSAAINLSVSLGSQPTATPGSGNGGGNGGGVGNNEGGGTTPGGGNNTSGGGNNTGGQVNTGGSPVIAPPTAFGKLPDTATNTPLMILIGSLLAAIGGISIVPARRLLQRLKLDVTNG